MTAALARRRRAVLVEGGADAPSGAPSTAAEGATDAGADADGAGVVASGEVEGDPWAEPGAPRPTNEDSGPTPLFGILGPTLLLAIGGAGVGLGVYAMLDGTCEVRGPLTGTCLRGEDPNVALGALLAVGGGIAAAGAVVWWLMGGREAREPRVDVVFLEGGGVALARGAF